MIMKTMNRLLGGLTAIAFTACAQDEWVDNTVQSQPTSGEKYDVIA